MRPGAASSSVGPRLRLLRRRCAGRRLFAPVAALVMALGLVIAPPGARTAAAAGTDLTVVSSARYDVQPDRQRVHVTVQLTATNRKPDTTTTYYYFNGFALQVPGATAGFKVSASGARPTVSVTRSTAQYRLLSIGFGRQLRSNQSMSLGLTFDLVDPGGAATRTLRIGQALVSFPVWAYGTPGTPGSRVSVVFPAGYSISPDTGDLPAPTTGAGGTIVLTSGAIADPLSFFAFLSADRPSAFTSSSMTTTVGTVQVPLTISAWPDDPQWGVRVGDLFRRGLPVLGGLIGTPYPRTDPLTVQESVSRSLGGYAGLFDPASGRIEVAYFASPLVVLHEASHAWFNGALLADRWANEAWASYYAERAAAALKVAATSPALSPTIEAARIPLNSWGAIGREADATESFGYAGSLAFARLVATRAGDAGLRSVWTAAADHEATYLPPSGAAGTTGSGSSAFPGGATPASSGPVDWRQLLDLFENRTGKSYTDLWRAWIVRPDEAALLDARTDARADYQATLTQAGAWQLPDVVRQALAAWQFGPARTLLAQARDVLARRDAVDAAATAAGLVPPITLEQAFEGADGLPAAAALADAQLAAVKTFEAAATTKPSDPDLVQQLGLWGSTPADSLAAARAAFATGDLRTAVADSELARATWTGAADLGRSRIVSAVVITIAALLLIGLALTSVRGFARRGRRRARMAHAVERAGSYATLRDTPGTPEASTPVRDLPDDPGAASR